MDIHKNARLTPLGREHMVTMVLGGQTPQAAGEAVGVCPRTVRKWLDRFKAEGLAGLRDRSSRPDHLRQPTPQATVDRIEALRRQRLTGKAIAAETGVSAATVTGTTPHPHQALHPEAQRQGRALHPDRLREWAYARAYDTSRQRAAELPYGI